MTTDRDPLTPIARKTLDVLGTTRSIIEWRPELSDRNTIVVVFDDERAAEITVREIPDPLIEGGPV